MTEEKTQIADGVASKLNAQLDTIEDGLMCVFVDDTEISHYLMGHINDIDNLEPWQRTVCTVGAKTIDKLRDEVKKLRQTIKQEAEYCYGWADHFYGLKDYDRAKRHKERGDRLMNGI